MDILGYIGFAVLIFLAVTWTFGVHTQLDAGTGTTAMRGGWRHVTLRCIIVVVLAAGAALSAPPPVPASSAGLDPGGLRMNIEQAFDRHHDWIMAVPGVTGLGIGDKDGKPAIIIMVRQLTPDLKTRLPRALEGHPVVVEQTGEIVAF